MYNNTVKDEILEKVDIVDIIGEIVQLKRRGSNYVGLCPFHNEKTPSFSVSQDKGMYKCFGCGKAGNVFTFMQEYHGLTFKESLKELALKLGIKYEEYSPEKKEEISKLELIYKALDYSAEFYRQCLTDKIGEQALAYYRKRGFSHETIEKFSLGFSPDAWSELVNFLNKMNFANDVLIEAGLAATKEDGKRVWDRFRGRAMFPIKNITGKIIGFGARDLSGADDTAKYLNSPQSVVYDKSLALYGLFQAKNEIRNKKSVILSEGYADVISLHQGGFTTAVASCGTALTIGQLKSLQRFAEKLFISYDSDKAGINATDKAIELALPLGFDIKVVRLPKGEDPDSLIRNNGAKLYQTYLDSAISFVDFKYEFFKESNNLDSPKEKSEFIKQVMKLITSIPDRLQHDFYISRLSSVMNLSESQIRDLYTRKSANEAPPLDEYYYYHHDDDNSVPPEFYSDNPEVGSNQSHDHLPVQIDISIDERILFEQIVSNEKVFPYCKKKLHISSNFFYSEWAKKIYETIDFLYEKHTNLSNALHHEDDTVDKDILNYLIDLNFHKDAISDSWIKFGVEEPEIDKKRILNDAIIGIELRKVEREINEITQNQKNKKDIELENLMKITELNQRRIKLKDSLNLDN